MTDASSPTSGLSEAEYARTERNRVLIGDEAQRRVHQAKVLMIGAGGLGSPCLLALTAAGIGAIDICETDTVDVSNLQRQTLYRVHDIGRPKAELAVERLSGLAPECTLRSVGRFSTDRAADLCAGVDLVIDGSDNFDTRFLAGDITAELGIPLVLGAVLGHEGQVAVFNWIDPDGRVGPCLRDLYPEPPSTPADPAQRGVLSSTTGVIGSLMAAEAIKVVSGASPAPGLLRYDGSRGSFKRFSISSS
ncbi:HesA/MoeB/ThiF family protein [Corynebacterium argentoratense]|uniref:HesA/MoeB/ThiF family protein n=1 Tax=Corynebacterium argentoratense TaxID=42817 RepID=UPI001F400D51|nr:HesA/MoeB/ThiF family protein [Corynebacterium argentoratense]MCF1693013.1 HesA/MoeB/ThiF family protein [Corynebacterium argentoratense]MCF1735258.1 HesA/MoeB/ThiF family protein [Corynebacterium argentoratense]